MVIFRCLHVLIHPSHSEDCSQISLKKCLLHFSLNNVHIFVPRYAKKIPRLLNATKDFIGRPFEAIHSLSETNAVRLLQGRQGDTLAGWL